MKRNTALIGAMALVAPFTHAAESRVALEEVVVTAQKQMENVQDVPIAVTVVNLETLKDVGVSNLKELSMVSSGVNITDANGYVFPIIRGVGSFIQGSSSSSSIATYMDGAYVARQTSAALQLDNVEAIEILKGPQATLYGRNATGGAINVTTTTTRPGEDFTGRVSLTKGSYDQKRASVFLASGLGEKLGANISGYWIQRDGYVKNLAPFNLDISGNPAERNEADCGNDLDSLCEFAGSAKLTYVPTEALEVSLGFGRSVYNDTAASSARQINPDGAQLAMFGASVQLGGGTIDQNGVTPGPGGFVFGLPPYTFASEYGTTYGHSNRRRGSDNNINLNISYETDSFTITSVTAHSESKANTSVDLLSASVPTLGFGGAQPSKTLTQEVRALSDYDGAVNWMAGINYFTDESDSQVTLANIIMGMPIIGERAEYETKAYAGFGEVYYDITDILRVTGGVRYTKEKVEVLTVATNPLSSVQPGDTSSSNDDAVTYRLVLDYHTDWGMLYGGVSSGYKSGGINASNPGAGPFEPETLTSFEVGAKSQWLDQRLRLNSAIFVYQFEDIQAQLVGGPTGGAQYFVNGKSADVSGIDIDFTGAITSQFTVWGGVTYLLDREYTDFDIPANSLTLTPALNVTGNKLVGAPEWSSVLGAKYDQPLGDLGDLTFNLNVSYNSGYFLTVENNLGTGGLNSADAVTLVNARLEYQAPNGFGLALWGKNLTDEEYVRSGLSALGGLTIVGQDGVPREVGVTATYKF